jgi:hypothetical protein
MHFPHEISVNVFKEFSYTLLQALSFFLNGLYDNNMYRHTFLTFKVIFPWRSAYLQAFVYFCLASKIIFQV